MPNTHQPKRLTSCELVALAAARPGPFAQSSEQHYQARIAAVTHEVLTTGRHIVMLTGPSAAGKTTSAQKLAAAIQAAGRRSAVLSLDDFYVGEGRYPKRADGTDDYECLESLDLPLLHQCLQALNTTGVCQAPVFDFKRQLPSGTQTIDCREGVVIIEGLHALNPALTAPLPQQAVLNLYASLREEYADANGDRCLNTRQIRLARRLVRDYHFRGHEPAYTLALWPHVCEGEDAYIRPYKSRADLLLDTTHSYEVCLWQPILAKLPAPQKAADAKKLAALQKAFAAFPPLSLNWVPQTSMLREFFGTQP